MGATYLFETQRDLGLTKDLSTILYFWRAWIRAD